MGITGGPTDPESAEAFRTGLLWLLTALVGDKPRSSGFEYTVEVGSETGAAVGLDFDLLSPEDFVDLEDFFAAAFFAFISFMI